MSRQLTKSILSRDEISLLLNSEEPKNESLYGNLFEVLKNVTDLKAISLARLDELKLDEAAKAALTYNKKSLMSNVNNEWYVEAESAEDESKKVRCGLCNTPNKYLFYIRNRINNRQLNVGSSCMKKFPSIEGYSDYKEQLNKTIRTQQSITRRTKFHEHFPNAKDILDSTSFYFDNLPILLPNTLYFPLRDTAKMIRIIYRDYVNYGRKPVDNHKDSFELFEEYVGQFYRLKHRADDFVRKNISNKFICRRDELDWLLTNKKTDLITAMTLNNGCYTQEVVKKMTYYKFLQRYFAMFNKARNTSNITIYNIQNENDTFRFTIKNCGCMFAYSIDKKRFMLNIGHKCMFEPHYHFQNADLFKVSTIMINQANLQNVLDIIEDKLNSFGYYILIDDVTNDIFLYKKLDKSIKEFTLKNFLKTYSLYAIQKSNDIYRTISLLTSKNWISFEKQEKIGMDTKIGQMYYYKYIEPYQ